MSELVDTDDTSEHADDRVARYGDTGEWLRPRGDQPVQANVVPVNHRAVADRYRAVADAAPSIANVMLSVAETHEDAARAEALALITNAFGDNDND